MTFGTIWNDYFGGQEVEVIMVENLLKKGL